MANVSIILAYIPFKYGEVVRYYFYKFTLKSLGENVTFKFGSYCQYMNSSIGSNVLVGYFNAIGEVELGNDILLGGYVNIISGVNQHSFDDKTLLIREQTGKGRMKVLIGNDVWVGSNSIIANHIGNRCVVAFGSVIVHSVNNNSLAGGSPAKELKKI
jgi:acetyltransferase-like isoleucine patch superfamily enzyme